MRDQRPPFRPKRVNPNSAPAGRHRFEPRNFEPRNKERDEEPVDQAGEPVRREAEYLRHLTDTKTPVAIHLITGETFQGFIEYYDKRFIRLTRQGAPNLFIFKHDIKYLREE